jgi:hypothetical protein
MTLTAAGALSISEYLWLVSLDRLVPFKLRFVEKN